MIFRKVDGSMNERLKIYIISGYIALIMSCLFVVPEIATIATRGYFRPGVFAFVTFTDKSSGCMMSEREAIVLHTADARYFHCAMHAGLGERIWYASDVSFIEPSSGESTFISAAFVIGMEYLTVLDECKSNTVSQIMIDKFMRGLIVAMITVMAIITVGYISSSL